MRNYLKVLSRGQCDEFFFFDDRDERSSMEAIARAERACSARPMIDFPRVAVYRRDSPVVYIPFLEIGESPDRPGMFDA